MLEIHETGPCHFDMIITGEVTKLDIEKAVAAFDRAVRTESQLYVLADLTRWRSITREAIAEDIRAGLRIFHQLNAPLRMAVITDRRWMRQILELETLLIPRADLKSFDPDQAELARSWLH